MIAVDTNVVVRVQSALALAGNGIELADAIHLRSRPLGRDVRFL